MSKADDGLRNLLKKHLPRPAGFIWTFLETGGTHSGVPDSFWANPITRNSGWIECKATKGWSVEVRPHQVSWCSQHHAAGARVHVAVRARGVGSSDGRGDSLWILRGDCLAELQEHGLHLAPEYVLGVFYGEPKKWPWATITDILCRNSDDTRLI